MRLAGKTALITGAARGIGLAFARAYAVDGSRVAPADIEVMRARDAAAWIGDAATAIEMDVSDQASIESGVAATIDALGQIDILINNAAIFTAAPITEITGDDYAQTFGINVAGTLFSLQAVARHMIAQGIQGRIINMASQAGRRGEPLVSVYCATEAAVISLAQSVGLNLIRHGNNVNAVSPSVVDGEHWDGVDALFVQYEGKRPGQKKKEVAAAVPFGRMGMPEDLTGMAIFLASNEARYIVAQTYKVDGGQWMS